MDLSIIIVSYNTKNILRDCLQSVLRHALGIAYEIIVVDNASRDESVAMLRQEFPSVKVIANSDNSGFAKANNQGMAAAQGRYLLLLNSDTLILDNGLKAVMEFADRQPDAGVIGCKVLNRDESLQYSCSHDPSLLTELMFFGKAIIHHAWDPLTHYKFMKYWDHAQTKPVDCLFGCFLWIRREVVQQLGGLDEKFFMYYEDVEFCRRVRGSKRFRIFYFPEVSIVHLGGMSADPANYSMLKYCYASIQYYFTKTRGRFAAWLFDGLCKTIWRMEIGVFWLFQQNPRVKRKLTMLQGFLKL